MGNLIVTVSGPTTAGKSTLVRSLQKKNPNIQEVISHTTRPMRPGEIDGEHYHFVSGETMESLTFVESVHLNNEWYGTTRAALMNKLATPDCIPILVVDPHAVAAFCDVLLDNGRPLYVYSVFLNVDYRIAAARMAERLKQTTKPGSMGLRLLNLYETELKEWSKVLDWNMYISSYDEDSKDTVEEMLLLQLKSAAAGLRLQDSNIVLNYNYSVKGYGRI